MRLQMKPRCARSVQKRPRADILPVRSRASLVNKRFITRLKKALKVFHKLRFPSWLLISLVLGVSIAGAGSPSFVVLLKVSNRPFAGLGHVPGYRHVGTQAFQAPYWNHSVTKPFLKLYFENISDLFTSTSVSVNYFKGLDLLICFLRGFL